MKIVIGNDAIVVAQLTSIGQVEVMVVDSIPTLEIVVLKLF